MKMWGECETTERTSAVATSLAHLITMLSTRTQIPNFQYSQFIQCIVSTIHGSSIHAKIQIQLSVDLKQIFGSEMSIREIMIFDRDLASLSRS